MGNKEKNKRVAKKRSYRQKYNSMIEVLKSQSSTRAYNPRKLSFLCKIAIRKYNLQQFVYKRETSKLEKYIPEPTSCTVVGGKPLRKRTPQSAPYPSTSGQKHKKKRNDQSADDSDGSAPSQQGVEGVKRGVGRPPKKRNPELEEKARGEPPKKSFPKISVSIADPNFETEIRIKQELDPEYEQQKDPFGPDDEEDYTVVVKEEFEAGEETLAGPSSRSSDTADGKSSLLTLVPIEIAGPSVSSSQSAATSGSPLITVVGDAIQIFANSVAEQLRAFPSHRAALLQLQIQKMLENERQLMLQYDY